MEVSCHLHPQSTLPWEKSKWYSLNRGLLGHRGWFGRLGKEKKCIAPAGNRPTISLSSIMLPHEALVQDLSVHILAMNLVSCLIYVIFASIFTRFSD
jgi:hypothetical protein